MTPDYDQDLQILAAGKAFDDSRWPGLLDHVGQRIDHIVYNDFPKLKIPLPEPPSSSTEGNNTPAKRRRDEPADKKSRLREEIPATPPSNGKSSGADPPSSTKDAPRSSNTEDKSIEDTEMEDAPSKSSPSTLSPPPNSLPPQLLTLLQTIQSTLHNNFPTSPPHTSQRLAELILHPTHHYRSLPSYLRALDRIVTVASPLSAFPLPTINRLSNGSETSTTLFNGTSPSPSPSPSKSSSTKSTLQNGDATFIGGAELTPIPWLRDSQSPPPLPSNTPHAPNHNNPQTAASSSSSHTTPGAQPPSGDLLTQSTTQIDGPRGAGSVETVTVSINGVSSTVPAERAREENLPTSVSQGELIRQEQEAGIAPVPVDLSAFRGMGAGGMPTSGAAAAAAAAATNGGGGPSSGGGGGGGEQAKDVMGEGSVEGEEETVHARGPSVIGMEDMGPQAPGSGLERGIDIEGPMGTRRETTDAGSGAMGTGPAPAETGDLARKGDEKMDEGKDGEVKDGDKKEDDKGPVTADPDGAVEGEKAAGERGVERGADAADTTAL